MDVHGVKPSPGSSMPGHSLVRWVAAYYHLTVLNPPRYDTRHWENAPPVFRTGLYCMSTSSAGLYLESIWHLDVHRPHTQYCDPVKGRSAASRAAFFPQMLGSFVKMAGSVASSGQRHLRNFELGLKVRVIKRILMNLPHKPWKDLHDCYSSLQFCLLKCHDVPCPSLFLTSRFGTRLFPHGFPGHL